MLSPPAHLLAALDKALDAVDRTPEEPDARLEVAACYLNLAAFYNQTGDTVNVVKSFENFKGVLDALYTDATLNIDAKRRLLLLSSALFVYYESRRELTPTLQYLRCMAGIALDLSSRWPSHKVWQLYNSEIQYANFRFELYSGNYSLARAAAAAGLRPLKAVHNLLDRQERKWLKKIEASIALSTSPIAVLLSFSISARIQLFIAKKIAPKHIKVGTLNPPSIYT